MLYLQNGYPYFEFVGHSHKHSGIRQPVYFLDHDGQGPFHTPYYSE